MDFLSREEVISGMNHSLEPMLERYKLDEVGIYEEEGEGETYYMGYTIKKDNKVFMVHLPYEKNQQGELAVKDSNWTIQIEGNEMKNCKTLDQVFNQIDRIGH
ncbi:DUF5634 family protein [Bacillus taeanensis]|uniref:GK1464-like domain-containing protein n=1 Tax=Bacillus taeanensis TaxID=273032 RepID=A0A366Y4B2_9BACI|nr:DUF5634 family protein [Bacillus taeanensis]RBW71031.1 hypothetical protein DS031_03300 [Bacillus taeanensis]